jgi:hypothetical protein
MAKKLTLTDEDDALLAELGIEIEIKTTSNYTIREERIISGFEEIQNFVKDEGRLPEHGEDKNIFERLYAVKLDQIRKLEESRTILIPLDHQGLLKKEFQTKSDIDADISDEEILAQLGIDDDDENAITNLKHVVTRAEKRAAEEVANRTICEDFENFKPLFESVLKDIDGGYREIIRFKKDAGFTKTSLKREQFIIIGGQMAYIATIGETIKAPNGDDDARLRVIYANGTESNILLRSLMRAMYKDETSRFITASDEGPLFSGENGENDIISGTIYVLRSLSDHPLVTANRELIHKIGVTGGDVKKRLVNAKFDPTFLMADVEIIATYQLANLNRTKLERLFHKFFSGAKLDVEIKDRFGRFVKAQEWFLVPLFIIDEMVEKIKDGTISNYFYDPNTAQLRRS